MKATINGINFELTTRVHQAPKDINGNVRWDIEVFANGDRLNDTIKGYRRVKNGYRMQAGSHGYDVETAIKDLLDAIVAQNEPKPIKTSNNKVTSEKIQDHIIEIISDEYGTTPAQKLESVVAGFHSWYGAYERRAQQNVQQAFADWLSCIPSAIDAEYRTYEQEELLTQWLGATGKEYSPDAIGARYYQLIFREFQKMCKKYGVQDLYGIKR